MIITSIILSALALILSMWMGRRNPVRSSGLTAGMLVLLMLSPLLLWMPKVYLELPWATSELAKFDNGNLLVKQSINWMTVCIWIYGMGCAVLLLKLLSHFLSARRWCSESVVDSSEQHRVLLEECAAQLHHTALPEVRFSEKVNSPVITGLLRPMLLLPTRATSWSSETLKMVMLHELGHLKRRDLWTNLAGQIACALHWFNPLVWMLRKRLTYECEYACDAHVISCGAHPGNYINALCDVAESCQESNMLKFRKGHSLAFSAALSMANSASLRSRVENLLEKRHGASKSSSLIVIGVLGISASVALAINLVRPNVSSNLREAQVTEIPPAPNQEEVNLRLTADPFPSE